MPRILYNNADLLLLSWFDDYFELNERQRSDLKRGIESDFSVLVNFSSILSNITQVRRFFLGLRILFLVLIFVSL